MALIMNIEDDNGSDVIQSFHEKFFTFDGPIYGSSDKTEKIKELRDQAYRELIKITEGHDIRIIDQKAIN